MLLFRNIWLILVRVQGVNMPELALKDAEGFKVWATMLVNNDESYMVPDANAQIDFFGQGDGSYLVINIYTSETSAVEYVFLAADEKDEGKAIVLIFDFLKTVNYSFHELLVWLENDNYLPAKIGNRVYAGGITISRDTIGSKPK
jgi:hypothetical protein